MLPFLFSLGLPALASTGALGATLGGMSGAALAGMGAGLGSFMETGDVGKGIKTGMLSFLGGKLLGGLGGGVAGLKDTAAGNAVLSGKAQAAMGTEAFGKAIANQGIKAPFSGIIGDNAASAILQPGIMTAAGIGSVANAAQKEPEKREDGERFEPPLPSALKKQVSIGDPLTGSGEQTYFDYTYTPDPTLEYPYVDYGTLQERNRQSAGVMGLAEGGEVEPINEKDIILESIMAIKGMKSEAEAQEVLGVFLAKYGEEALRDLVSSVQSGEYDDTVARFAEGEKGMVRGPGDGSGSDDKVPATLDNQQDVLLTEGEFVIRKPTTDALTKAYGGGFLDKINEAEGDAPEVLRKMVG